MERILAKEPKKLDDLFHDTLKDIYFAEKKILATLPKMAKAANSADLKAAFEEHREQTEGHVDRLDQIFAMIDEAAARLARPRRPRKRVGFGATDGRGAWPSAPVQTTSYVFDLVGAAGFERAAPCAQKRNRPGCGPRRLLS